MFFSFCSHKKRIILPLYICVCSLLGCSNVSALEETYPTPKKHIGFNMRWGDTPVITEKLVSTISKMEPTMLRYPGGTMAHNFNWETGLPSEPTVKDIEHKIEDVKLLADGTNTQIIFVVDIVKSTMENQLKMLEAAKVPVRFVEIGNELYFDHYEDVFPSGKAYADTINKWVPRIRKKFPLAKFGVSMIGRQAGNERKQNWNQDVYSNIKVAIDALVYHLYVHADETVQHRIDRFLPHYIKDENKELWVTEYGAQSHSIEQTEELADYVESIATISLSHVLISRSGRYSKIDDESELTEEGAFFVKRRNKNNQY
ncbi:glycosyl hydrolase [Flavicella marina]|uniref:glycosyl hydrolase n=1 Tax=Flavicella marina TaxID=1475951 RepID=UPI00186ABD2F|nr:glycosyl hydrolase [Flavicella marina]